MSFDAVAPQATRTVVNQPPPLAGYDVFGADAALREGVGRWVGAAERAEVEAGLGALGLAAGSAGWQRLGEAADANPRCCAPMTATATGSTRSSSTPPGTG